MFRALEHKLGIEEYDAVFKALLTFTQKMVNALVQWQRCCTSILGVWFCFFNESKADYIGHRRKSQWLLRLKPTLGSHIT